MNDLSDYQTRLAQWKAKHGLVEAKDDNRAEAIMEAEDRVSKNTAPCFGCGKEMPVSEMKIITRRVDPYLQCDEGESDYIRKGNRVRMCPECFQEKYPSKQS